MSPAIALPPPRAAASNGMFRRGGDSYTLLPDLVCGLLPELIQDLGLPKKEQKASINAARAVLPHLVKLAQADALDERATTAAIASATGISQTSVQRALYLLDVAFRRIGMPIIDRFRAHGRRIISFVRGFAAKGTAPAPLPPPAPPIKTEETTTTREPSSSPRSAEEKTGEGGEIAPPELVDRACRLIPEATPGKVADAVAVYSADWVNQALDRVVKRNAKPGNKPVESWGFMLRILEEWKRLDGPPPPKPTAPPAQARAKVEPPKEETPYRLTAEEVAELVRKCQSSRPSDLPAMARVQLRQALAEGSIPAELVATIPPELVNPPKPRAP